MNLLGSLGKMASQAAQKLKEEMTGQPTPGETPKSTADKADKTSEVDFYRGKVALLQKQIRTMADQQALLSKEIGSLKAENESICESYSTLDAEKNNIEVMLKRQIEELETKLRERPEPMLAVPVNLLELKRQVEGLFTSQFDAIVVHVLRAIQETLDRQVGEHVEIVFPPIAIITSQDVERIIEQLKPAKNNEQEVQELSKLVDSTKLISEQSQAKLVEGYEGRLQALQLELSRVLQERLSIEQNYALFEANNLDLQEKVGYLEACNNQLSESSNELRQRLAISEAEFSRMRSSFDEMEMNYRGRLSREQQIASEAEQVSKVLSLQLTDLKTQTANNDQKIQQQLDELSNLNEEYAGQVTVLTNALQNHQTEASGLRQKLMYETSRYQQIIAELQQSSSSQHQQATETAASQQYRLNELLETVDRLQMEVLDQSTSNLSLKNQLRNAQEASSIAEGQLIQLNQELAALKLELERKNQDIRGDLGVVTNLEVSLRNANQVLRQTQEQLKEMGAANGLYQREILQLTRSNELLESYISVSTRTVDETSKDIEHLLICYEEQLQELRTAYQPFSQAPIFGDSSKTQPVEVDTDKHLAVVRETNRALRVDLLHRESQINELVARLRQLEDSPQIVTVQQFIKDEQLEKENARLERELNAMQEDMSYFITNNKNHEAELRLQYQTTIKSLQAKHRQVEAQLLLKSEELLQSSSSIGVVRQQLEQFSISSEAEKAQLINELRNLQWQHSTLQMQLDTALITIDQNHDKIMDLQDKVERRQEVDAEQINRLMQQVYELKEKDQLAEKRMADASAAYLQDKTYIQQQWQIQAEEANRIITELTRKIEDTEQMVFELEEERARSRIQTARLEQILDTATQSDREQQEQIRLLKQQIGQMQLVIQDQQNNLHELQIRARADQGQIRHAALLQKQIEERLVATTQQAEQLRETVSQQEKIVNHMTTLNIELEEKLHLKESNLKDLHKTSMKASTEAKRENEKLKHRVSQLEQREEIHKVQVQRLNQQLEGMNAFQQSIQEFQRKELKLTQELTNSRRDLDITQKLLEQRTNELLKFDAHVEDLETMRAQLRAWKEIDNRFQQAFHRRLNEQNIVEVVAKWASARQKFSEIERELIDTKQKLSLAMEELKGKSEALIRINLGMVENMKENDELKSQLENAMQINSDAEEYKSLLEKENQALRTNSERQIEGLRKTLEQSEAKLKQVLQKELIAQTERARLEESEKQKKLLLARQQQSENAIAKVRQEAAEIENGVRRQLRIKEEEAEKLLRELDKSKMETAKLKQTIEEERTSARNELTRVKNQYEEQSNKLTAKLEETKASCDKISLNLAQKDSAINQKAQELLAKNNELATAIKEKRTLEGKLEELSTDFTRYQDLQIHCNSLNQRLILKDEEIQNTLARLNGLNSTITSLEEGIETNQRFAEEKAAENERLNDLLDTMRDQLAVADQERERLSKDLSMKDKELSRLASASEVNSKIVGRATNARNGHESIDLIVIKNIFIKYFDIQSSVTDRLHTLDTLCSVLQVTEREKQHLQLYRKRITEKETLAERNDDRPRQGRPIQEKLFSFFSNAADE